MANLATLLLELADLREMEAAKLRTFAASVTEAPRPSEPDVDVPPPTLDVVARARLHHPSLGPRQEEILRLVADAGSEGVATGQLARAMDYDQPNIHLTLQALIRHQLVRRETGSRPYRYFLSSTLTVQAP